MKYKVLWFDDEHLKLETIKEDALNYNIELIGYSNAKDGIEELKNNFNKFYAVVVDGLFFDSPEQKGSAVENTAFGEVAKFLTGEKARGNFMPWFIFSGQPSFVKEKNDLVKVLADKDFGSGKVYDKNNDDDFVKLCEEIVISTNTIAEKRVKITYSKSFKVFALKIVDSKYEHNLVELLVCLENKDFKKKNLNVVRDILESIFLTLINDFECIPETFKNDKGKPNLEWCTRYLEGRRTMDAGGKDFQCSMKIPAHISSNIRYIKEVSNAYSHLSENEKVETSFKSATFSMIEVLEWIPHFIEENFDI
tara:strand:- start:3032 stop:3955 length:924 start_codon:yes stop_codon:yes gene_type:complete